LSFSAAGFGGLYAALHLDKTIPADATVKVTLMEIENLNIEEIMVTRRHAVEKSLRTISVAELKALTDELFPDVDHPWLEKFLSVISDPTSGLLHLAITDDRIHMLYCHDKEIGMWFVRGLGKGPLQPEELKIMKEIVEAGS